MNSSKWMISEKFIDKKSCFFRLFGVGDDKFDEKSASKCTRDTVDIEKNGIGTLLTSAVKRWPLALPESETT
uniref:Uncharacterized protein n=1 Tax=viral metagenome TaxID=1070528 RepID=A0A6M3IN69_9ZZZZ